MLHCQQCLRAYETAKGERARGHDDDDGLVWTSSDSDESDIGSDNSSDAASDEGRVDSDDEEVSPSDDAPSLIAAPDLTDVGCVVDRARAKREVLGSAAVPVAAVDLIDFECAIVTKRANVTREAPPPVL